MFEVLVFAKTATSVFIREGMRFGNSEIGGDPNDGKDIKFILLLTVN